MQGSGERGIELATLDEMLAIRIHCLKETHGKTNHHYNTP